MNSIFHLPKNGEHDNLTRFIKKMTLTEAKFVESHLQVALSRHLDIPMSKVTVATLLNTEHDFIIEHSPHHRDRYVKVGDNVDGEIVYKTILTFRRNGLTLKAIHED